MANEIRIRLEPNLADFYVHLMSPSGTVYNQSSGLLETVQFLNWVNYSIGLAEAAGTGYYFGTMPVNLPVGIYDLWIYQQTDSLPDPGTDSVVGKGVVDWSGTADLSLASIFYTLPAVVVGQATNLLQAIHKTYRRFFKRVKDDKVAKTITLYKDDLVSPETVQHFTSDGNADDLGAGS